MKTWLKYYWAPTVYIFIFLGIMGAFLFGIYSDNKTRNKEHSEENRLKINCALLCDDHRVISCVVDDKILVVTCADRDAKLGYRVKIGGY